MVLFFVDEVFSVFGLGVFILIIMEMGVLLVFIIFVNIFVFILFWVLFIWMDVNWVNLI